MKDKKIAILGGGNLGQAIALGLLDSKTPSKNIYVTRRKLDSVEYLEKRGVHVTSDNRAAVKASTYILLCVQPAQLASLIDEIKGSLDPKKHVLVSVITGKSIEQIQSLLGKHFPILRCMPNTAIAIRESMTCIATNDLGQKSLEHVHEIFECLGSVLVIEESLMSSATVLGASGIAFCMRFIRAATQGGIQLGFDWEDSLKIAIQTCKGASGLLVKNKSHPEQEIDKVTTPQGCTIAGLNEMEHHGFSSAYIRGLITSHERIKHMK